MAVILASDEPSHRLLAALHGGSRVVIDGDAAATRGWPEDSIDRQRGALVDYCRSMATWLSIDQPVVRIFFDRSMDDAVPRSKSVTVELVDDRTTAAERALVVIESGTPVIAIWGDDATV